MEEVRRLYCRALSLAEQLDDMLILSWTDTGQYAGSSGMDMYLEPLEQVTFKVMDLEDGTGGIWDPVTRTLMIARKYADRDSVVLHELLHVYEDAVNGAKWASYRYTLVFHYYRKLKGFIGNLDDIITMFMDLSNIEHFMRGGEHSILFILKSLELDMRNGWDPGTVFGYDMKEIIQAQTGKEGC